MDHLKNLQSKLVETDQIDKHVSRWKMLDDKIIFTNGCFDILHYGHISMLCQAKDLGDRLIVGINTDDSVKRLKGENRPLNSLEERIMVLSALGMVDMVVTFDQDTPLELIKQINPDVLVKGGDWKKEDVVGSDLVEKKGGLVVLIPYVEGFSTSSLEDKIKAMAKVGV